MPQVAVEVHSLAADEATAAERWYRERNEVTAAGFRRELDSAVERIAERPEAHPRKQSAHPPAASHFSSCIVFAWRASRSSLSQMRGGGRGTGAIVSRITYPLSRGH